MTTTPKDDLPEARILPEVMYVTNNGISQMIMGVASEIRLCSSIPFDDKQGTKYIRADLCTPAIADGSDLFICRRTVAGDNRDGATRYYVYQELRPYDGAIADGVGVKFDGLEPSDFAAALKWHEDIMSGSRFYYTIWCALNYFASTPPQAATD